MLKRSNIFGYGEVNQYNRSSTLMSAYKHLEHQQFLYYVIKEKAEIYSALKTFFKKREAAVLCEKSDRSPGGDDRFPIKGGGNMALAKLILCMTVGLILAIVAIGLLPFLLVFLVMDASGMSELDPTPIYTLVNKFIGWGK